MQNSKYHLKCVGCGYVTPNFSLWFKQNQICPKCGSKHTEIEYNTDYSLLGKLLNNSHRHAEHDSASSYLQEIAGQARNDKFHFPLERAEGEVFCKGYGRCSRNCRSQLIRYMVFDYICK